MFRRGVFFPEGATVQPARLVQALRRAVLDATLVVPDGQPLVWALRALGHRTATRVYGPDLMERYCEHAAQTGTTAFLYGGRNEAALVKLAVNLRTRFPGIELVEPAEQDLCCGSAGIYNLVQPDAARELGDRKAQRVLDTGADAYASANPGCLVQVSAALRRVGRPLPAFHPIELLDASIRGVDPDRLLKEARQ